MTTPTKPSEPIYNTRVWDVPGPCPDCGNEMLFGYHFLNPETKSHQHTHYVCVAWPHPGERCGWHGWSVPGWRTSTHELPEREVDLLGDAIMLAVWEEPLKLSKLFTLMKAHKFETLAIGKKIDELAREGQVDVYLSKKGNYKVEVAGRRKH